MKQCKVCLVTKPLDDFPACNGLLDGRRNECRACTKTYIRKWRDKNAVVQFAKAKAYAALPHVRHATYILNAEWRKNNRMKMRAHSVFHHALNTGRVKPQLCWVCGQQAEAHHPDYSAPLDVVWLCKSHHRQAHALVQGLSL